MSESLLDLQRIDVELDRLRHRLAELEAGTEFAEARTRVDEAERKLGELRLSLDDLARNQQRLEHEDASLQAKIEAERRRLYDGSVTNAKELAALEAEIENLRGRTGRIEDELLEVMVKREDLEREVRTAERALEEARAARDRVEAANRAERSEIEAGVRELVRTRENLAATLENELLELYEDLRSSKHGVGAAALVDGVCQGCHETLSALEIDRLRKAEGVKRCPHCRRILVA